MTVGSLSSSLVLRPNNPLPSGAGKEGERKRGREGERKRGREEERKRGREGERGADEGRER